MSKTNKLKVPKRDPRPGEGRPTKYKPEYCQQMIDYFNVEIYKEGYKKELNLLPTFQGFAAKELGVTTNTLLNWAEENDEFLRAYNVCKELQEQLLVQGGISRAYDGNFTKFILNSVSKTFKEKVVLEADDETKNIIKLAYALPAKNEG